MNRKIHSRFFPGMPVLSFLLIILLISCGKTGPQGSTGPAGPTGAAGPAGPAGPTGPQGNANVLVDTFTVTSSQWLWNSQYAFQTNPSSYTEYFTRYYDAAFPSVTQSILSTGMVLGYFTPNTSNNNNQWAPLPYQFTDGSGNFDYNMAFETNLGTVRLHYFFVQRNAAATIPTLSTYTIATYKFKLVAVSGTIVSGMKKAHIDPSDYNAVSHFVGF